VVNGVSDHLLVYLILAALIPPHRDDILMHLQHPLLRILLLFGYFLHHLGPQYSLVLFNCYLDLFPEQASRECEFAEQEPFKEGQFHIHHLVEGPHMVELQFLDSLNQGVLLRGKLQLDVISQGEIHQEMGVGELQSLLSRGGSA
jgi:hypothetical protein